MEAVSRWLCSFVADKVRVNQYGRTITCGDRVLLCSIHLISPKSKFTNYHKNVITISYVDENTEKVQDCEFHINQVSESQLDIFCVLRRAGYAIVKLDLGKWYLFEGKVKRSF